MQHSSRGIALKLGATFAFSVQYVALKLAGNTVPVGEVVFFRAFFALLPLLILSFYTVGPAELIRTARPGLHLMRSAIGSSSMLSFCAVLGAITMIRWRVPLSAGMATWLILGGISGGFGQILMTFSYRFAEPSLLAPFDYTAMIWAVAFGYLVFAEVPMTLVLAGAAVVTAAGAFIAIRKHRLGRELASRVEAV